jgi:NADPH:quinone reductase-like Zn-dependent oxidoreductase
MKALVFEQYGGPEVLRVAEVAEPHAGPGQIRIAVRTAGVSPGDDAMRSGAWRDRVPLTLPHVVGLDAAGIVDEVGAGVTGVRPGAEVFGLRALGGATAEHARLDAWAAKPPGMTWAQAGGAASGIETSVRALDALGVGPGTTVLLDGASGGVGAFAVQIAVARGARVIGTASPANHEFLASLGAEPVAYGPGLPERIGSPVDAAIDVAGRGGLAELMALTGDPAAVLTLIDPAAAALGVRLSRFDPAGDHQAALSYGARLIADGRLTVPVAAVFPITAGAAAHARVATGHARGKVVIEVYGALTD